jgi:hypothetical protein
MNITRPEFTYLVEQAEDMDLVHQVADPPLLAPLREDTPTAVPAQTLQNEPYSIPHGLYAAAVPAANTAAAIWLQLPG